MAEDHPTVADHAHVLSTDIWVSLLQFCMFEYELHLNNLIFQPMNQMQKPLQEDQFYNSSLGNEFLITT